MNPQLQSESAIEPGPCAIGVDVGGTKIAAGVVALVDGAVAARREMPTFPKRGGKAVLSDVRRMVEELAADARSLSLSIEGIGIAVCELVDVTGSMASANCVDWRDLPIQERLSSIAPAVIEADVRAAALGEALFGAGKRFKTFLYLTVGTGISSCLVIDGTPFTGARGATGTIASSPLGHVCEKCGHVESRSLEEFASGPALVARYNRESQASADSAEDVVAAAKANHPVAVAIVGSASEALGRTVGLLVNTLDPDAVIVGGGLGLSGGIYWERLQAATRRQIWSDLHRQLPIIPAGLGRDAGVIGAAASAWLRRR